MDDPDTGQVPADDPWAAGAAEEPLLGGDVTEGVVRAAGTVRRPQGRHSPTVHRMLRHLEAVGFTGAPRLLGVDGAAREVLTFLDGEVAGRPWPRWVGDDDRAVSVARLLRRLDDALATLGLPDGTIVEADELSLGGPPLAERPGPPPTFLGHRDVTPENTVFRDGLAYALIDFDLAGPCSRLDEVTNLLLWWGAWLPAADRDPVFDGVDPAFRGRLLVDAYALEDDLRPLVVPFARYAAARSWHRMRRRALVDGGGWARMWAEGAGDQILRRAVWLEQEEDTLTAALVDDLVPRSAPEATR